MKRGIQLLIHSQTATVAQLKFVNGKVISHHASLVMWLLIHAWIEIDVSKMVPGHHEQYITVTL